MYYQNPLSKMASSSCKPNSLAILAYVRIHVCVCVCVCVCLYSHNEYEVSEIAEVIMEYNKLPNEFVMFVYTLMSDQKPI